MYLMAFSAPLFFNPILTAFAPTELPGTRRLAIKTFPLNIVLSPGVHSPFGFAVNSYAWSASRLISTTSPLA
jgi:hypothetical protein